MALRAECDGNLAWREVIERVAARLQVDEDDLAILALAGGKALLDLGLIA
mgnify:CR=1 FL=1